MTNKKFRLAAMSIATAVAVSAVGPSASAVTYDLVEGSVTVDRDEEKGAFSYQGEDSDDSNRTYVNEDKEDDGKIIIKDSSKKDDSSSESEKTEEKDSSVENADNAEGGSSAETEPSSKGNTVTIKEDVKKTEDGRDVEIIIDGVDADTSDTKQSTVTVGEGADVDLTVKDSTLTTGGNGIDIGADLDGKDEHKETHVDLTLDNTNINLTQNNTAGIDVREGSDVDLTLKGDNTIDGAEALEKIEEDAAKAKEEGKAPVSSNVEGIRVSGEGASDSSDNDGKNAELNIHGREDEEEKDEEDGSLTIENTSSGVVMASGAQVTLDNGADVTVKNSKTTNSTQSGTGIIQHGDLTVKDNSTLTVDGADRIGIASWDDIKVEDGSTLNVKNTQDGIYGHQDSTASLTVDNSTLNISDVGAGIRYEGGGKDKEGNSHTAAGDITFKDANVEIDAEKYGITTGSDSESSVNFVENTKAKITVKGAEGYAIYGADNSGRGELNVDNSQLDIDASTKHAYGIRAGYKNVNIRNGSVVNSNSDAAGMIIAGGENNATKLHISNSLYNVTTRYHYGVWACVDEGTYQHMPTHTILVDDNGALNIHVRAGQSRASSGIMLDDGASLVVDNGIVTTSGKYKYGGVCAYGNDIDIRIKNSSHVDTESIRTYDADHKNQNLIVTGGTLTYDYSAENTLWPENEQGEKLTNFLLTKDAGHANFDALSYKGTTYTYLSDLEKEKETPYLSVWVPASALEYMLDVDGSHDPEIIGKVLEELKQGGYTFNTAYRSNGDEVIILRDMVVNGQSLNFTKTTDENGNTKLRWGNYENQKDGAPSAYDMVYGTEYEFEGKKYTIVWGYESAHNPDGTSADGVLDSFDADARVKTIGENIIGENSGDYTVTIYGALREVPDPVIPAVPEQPVVPTTPDVEPTSPQTPPAAETPVNPPVQDARPTAPAVEQISANTPPAPETPVNPPVQDARPDSAAKMIQTGTTRWAADLLLGAGAVLAAAGYALERKRKAMCHHNKH